MANYEYRTNIDFDKIFYSLNGHKPYRILEELDPVITEKSKTRKVRIMFLDTGYVCDVELKCALRGTVRDLTNTIKLYGEKYLIAQKEIKGIDKEILFIWHTIITRCYKKEDISYKYYGAKGVTVCDEWRWDPYKFIEDFKRLPGYNNWLHAKKEDRRHWQIDKDLLQQNIPVEQRQYSFNTCCIVHNDINRRIGAVIKNKESNKYLGVSRLPADKYTSACTATIIYDKITYRIGFFSNEIAAASAYNFVARQLPYTLLNDLNGNEMDIHEWIKYRTSKAPMILPRGIKLPNDILRDYEVIYDGSKYDGVKKQEKRKFRSYAYKDEKEIYLGTYTSELAAVSASIYFCRNNNILSKDIIKDNQLIPEDQLENYLVKKQYKQRTSKYPLIHIGDRFQNKDGRWFTIIDIPTPIESVEVSERSSLPIIIKFDGTGSILNINYRILLHSNKVNTIKDYNLPSVYGVGYLGMQTTPQDRETKKIKQIWYAMLGRAYNKNSKNYIGCKVDPRWHSFKNFLEDFFLLPGYNEFVNNNYEGVLQNQLSQENIPEIEWVWSKDTCILINKISKTPGNYKGVYMNTHDDGTVNYHASITDTNTHKRISIGTFDDARMAAAAVDFYSQAFNGVYFNGIGNSIPVYEWQRHKSRMQQLYHLVQRPLYTLTNESEEARRERCKRIYGIEI